jgi:CHASE3 domain sensor protein
MTIAKRLSILLAVPLLILVGIGVITRQQLAGVEERTRFVAVSRVAAMARLGDISRSFGEMRVNVRSVLLATSPAVQAAVREDFDRHRSDLTRLLDDYADNRIASDRGRRFMIDFRTMGREWTAGAEQVMSLAEAGRADEANALLSGSMAALGEKLSGVLNDWIRQNESDATDAGRVALDSIERSRQNLLIAILVALALSGTLGFLTFRKIVHPIRSLRSSVESIAGGEFANTVPFTKSIDETGDLARSIDVLKRGAAAMEEQRWVKANQAVLTGDLQGAASLAEFGERFVSGLVPVLGGGVAGFYVLENDTGCLRRIASYGLTPGESPGESFRPGEGLVGLPGR